MTIISDSDRDPWQVTFESTWDQLRLPRSPTPDQRLPALREINQPLLAALDQQPYGNQERLGWVSYLLEDLCEGFQPRYMLSYHYKSPTESGCSLYRRPLSSKNCSAGPRARASSHQPSVLKQVSRYSALERRRNDPTVISRDACHTRNILKQKFWQHSVPRRERVKPHLYFFHEHGTAGLQIHTHLLISQPPAPFSTAEQIERGWKDLILPKVQVLSRAAPGFDIKEIPTVFDEIGRILYLTKEVTTNRPVIDTTASCMLADSARSTNQRRH
jgi:hypothetical protein